MNGRSNPDAQMQPGPEASKAVREAIEAGRPDDVWEIVGDGDICDFV